MGRGASDARERAWATMGLDRGGAVRLRWQYFVHAKDAKITKSPRRTARRGVASQVEKLRLRRLGSLCPSCLCADPNAASYGPCPSQLDVDIQREGTRSEVRLRSGDKTAIIVLAAHCG